MRLGECHRQDQGYFPNQRFILVPNLVAPISPVKKVVKGFSTIHNYSMFYVPPLLNGRPKHEAEPANLETVGESTNFRTRLP